MTTETWTGTVPEITIAERCFLARRDAHLSQDELASRIHVSGSTVQNYENRDYGKRRRVSTLRAWAKECNVNLAWLQTGKPGPDNTGPGLWVVAGEGFEPSTSGLLVGMRPSGVRDRSRFRHRHVALAETA